MRYILPRALQDAEDAMIATEQSGFLTRLLSAMWVNARLATAQENLEGSYKQLVVKHFTLISPLTLSYNPRTGCHPDYRSIDNGSCRSSSLHPR